MVENHELYFHGRPDPASGQISIGLVLVKQGRVLDTMNGSVSYSGSREKAQWEALVQGMLFASSHDVRRLIMKGDSKYVINYMNGEMPRRDFTEMEHLLIARKKQLLFDQCFFQWVPESANSQAIQLSRSA
ncbi:MAG: reverse transcriptase-like protein [Candidatus Thermoplasmatota archaeon]|nr:reverse transcriptase-like protein [Candidatus Thermoplasmatota archaeon]